MIILPDLTNSKGVVSTGSHLSDAGMLPEIKVGMDVLAKLHLYIAFKERKLYITPADDKAGKMLPAVVAPPAAQNAGNSPP